MCGGLAGGISIPADGERSAVEDPVERFLQTQWVGENSPVNPAPLPGLRVRSKLSAQLADSLR